MKPNFALTLSFEGIGLLHRAFPGWHMVGEVDLNAPDLAAALAALRDRAQALDPTGLRSKLVIPNDQIRYLRLDPPKGDAADIPALVEEALKGATPYRVEDLAHDWSRTEDALLVAVVAKDTLREAEDFAREHRFNPVSFVAAPASGEFAGEPFFGETPLAATLAGEAGALQRDTVPVRVIGTARSPAATDDSARAPDAGEAADAATEESAVAAPFPVAAEPAPLPAGFAEPPARFEGGPAKVAGAAGPKAETGKASDPPEDTAAPPAPDVAPATEATPAEKAPTFSSIRAHRGEMPARAPRLDGVARHFQPLPAGDDAADDALETTSAADPDAAQAPSGTSPPAMTRTDAAPPRPVLAPGARPRPTARPTHEEKQRMTVFGARETPAVGGKPRYLGVILTAILLVFLAGVAAWASIFLEDGLAGVFRSETPEVIVAEVPATPELDDTPPASADTPDAAGPAPAAAPDAEVVTAALDQNAGADTERAAQDAAPATAPPRALSDDEVRASYAATGIWQRAPRIHAAPAPDNLDEFYQTSIDGAVTMQDAVALPAATAQRTDTRPDTPHSPAGAGTTFAHDDRGLVIATAEGALTPDGVRVIAGRPLPAPAAFPVRAPETTGNDTASGTGETGEDSNPDTAADTDTAAALDPETARLAGFRPRPRPGDLSEQNERGTLSGRTRDELAELRPRLRPERPIASDTDNTVAAASAVRPFIDLDAVNSAVNQAVQSDAAAAPARSATPQAVAASLKPAKRPADLGRAAAAPRSTRTPAVTARSVQPSAPRIPTSTSVASQATERNVLKMRKVNLIGVYGSPKSRRALVRLSNGRYQKVQVGDRLDGGRVSAIGAHELRYTKRGRNVVLTMPRG